jgi:hypothetical protein
LAGGGYMLGRRSALRAGRRPKHLPPFTRFLIANGIPFEPIVMKPLRGRTDFQGLYSLISFRYEAKEFRAEPILLAGRFA